MPLYMEVKDSLFEKLDGMFYGKLDIPASFNSIKPPTTLVDGGNDGDGGAGNAAAGAAGHVRVVSVAAGGAGGRRIPMFAPPKFNIKTGRVKKAKRQQRRKWQPATGYSADLARKRLLYEEDDEDDEDDEADEDEGEDEDSQYRYAWPSADHVRQALHAPDTSGYQSILVDTSPSPRPVASSTPATALWPPPARTQQSGATSSQSPLYQNIMSTINDTKRLLRGMPVYAPQI
ncbi:MAG: hypothetical protein ACRC0J_11340 [Shewanella oncorhynchi]